MTERPACPRCGSELRAGAPRGLCPLCLLREGFDSEALSLTTGGVPAATLSLAGGAGGSSVLEVLATSVGPVPRILLHDTDTAEAPAPVVRPGSDAMPPPDGRPARLRLLGELARGGMGAVLKGRDEDLGRDLAVKVLLEELRDKPDLVRRFVEEAQITGQLQHPGIAPVYELGALADRRPYFTMKLVKGRTLADLLRDREGPDLGVPRLLGIFDQVAHTVAYAHARGVIHRDLKPSNVMVGSFGEVQVMDWGLAKVLPRGGVVDDAAAGKRTEDTVIATARSGEPDSDLSKAGSVMGTPAYMAPEQARGEIDLVDARADVFALGSILCEILTRAPAFAGRNSGEIQRKAARGDVDEARERLGASGADPQLVALCLACLAPEREDRPLNAGAVAARTTDYLNSVHRRMREAELAQAAEAARAVEARRTAEAAEARALAERRARRSQLALAASILALTILGGLGLAEYFRQRQARAARVELALNEAALLHNQAEAAEGDPARWAAAVEAAHHLAKDFDSVPDEPTHRRVAGLVRAIEDGAAAARADRELLSRLVEIRTVVSFDHSINPRFEAEYARAFADAGYEILGEPPEQVGAAIARRPRSVALPLAAALDDWARRRRFTSGDPEGAMQLVAIARIADPEPWRCRLRTASIERDRDGVMQALRAQAQDARIAELSAANIIQLGGGLLGSDDLEQAASVLRTGLRRYPSDAWINYLLACTLNAQRHRQEAIRYFTAARALQPEMAGGLAFMLLEVGQGQAALEVWRDLVARRPDVVANHLSLARVLRILGRSSEAREVAAQAIRLAREAVRDHPESPWAHFQLGPALSNSGRNLGEAIDAFREVLRLRPDSAQARIWLVSLLSADDPNGALAAGREALAHLHEDASSSASMHVTLAYILRELGRIPEATAELREATRLRPDNVVAQLSLADILRRSGEHRQAVDAARKAPRLRPTLADARDIVTNSLLDLGRIDEAVAQAREGLLPGNNGAAAVATLAEALFRAGRTAEALDLFRDALRRTPGDALLHFKFGDFQRNRLNDYDGAIASYRKHIELDPDAPPGIPGSDAHGGLGLALCEKGLYAEAIVELRNADRISPGYHAGWVQRSLAKALRATDDLEGGVEALQRAIRIGPGEPIFRGLLADALAEIGRRREALDARREAARLKPNDPEIRLRLGESLLDVGEFDAAREALREAARLAPASSDVAAATAGALERAERWRGLADRLTAVLGGHFAATASERAEFAAVASRIGRPAAAARLWTEALESGPAPADDLRSRHRTDAACAAALAGCGRGRDDPPPDGAARAALRQKALAWLRADLVWLSKQLDGGPGTARQDARRTLIRWKNDPDLAGVRDPGDMTMLPEAERDAWRALWAETSRLLKHSDQAPWPPQSASPAGGDSSATPGRLSAGRLRPPSSAFALAPPELADDARRDVRSTQVAASRAVLCSRRSPWWSWSRRRA